MDSTFAKIGLGVVVLLLIVFVVFQMWVRDDRPRYGADAYYFNIENGELFTHDAKAGSPIEVDGKEVGYLAKVFACGDCADEDARFIGYLEAGGSIRAVDGEDWVNINSEAAMELMDRADDECSGGKPLKTCYPPID